LKVLIAGLQDCKILLLIWYAEYYIVIDPRAERFGPVAETRNVNSFQVLTGG
jgi:hypothetical protein